MPTTIWVCVCYDQSIDQCQLTLHIGYYIHSCVKMKYKGNFRPQYILGKAQLFLISHAPSLNEALV